MIRINLLGTTKKKQRRPSFSMPVVPAEGPSLLVVGLLVAVIAIGLNYWYLTRLQHEQEKVKQDLVTADAQIAQLSSIKQKYMQRQKEADEAKRRVDVIDQLRAKQTGPVMLLSMLGQSVNSTDAVWLLKMTDDGAKVKLEGVALSPTSLANLMTNLRKTGYFSNVELDETVEESGKKVRMFSFKLTCDKSKA